MSGRRVPFSKRNDPEAAMRHRDALHEGVPEHLLSSIDEFLCRVILSTNDIQSIERTLECPLPGAGVGNQWQDRLLGDVRNKSEEFVLDVVHERLGTIRQEGSTNKGAAVGLLRVALIDGGSAYEVVPTDDGMYGLSDRVDQTTKAAAEQAMSHGRSGDYLRMAWSDLYGRGPSSGYAYGHAIKAVEAAALPVVVPNQAEGTLSDVINALRNAPEGKYRALLLGKNDAADSVNIVRLMTQLLWTHDHARHGNADDSKPVTVSREEAEAAVHLAITLVQWFESGAVWMA